MQTSTSHSRGGLILIVLAALLWGTIGVAAQGIYHLTATNSFSISFFRLALSTPFLWVASARLLGRRLFQISRGDLGMILFMGVLVGLYQSAYLASITYAGVTIATLVSICIAPLIVALLSALTGRERLTRSIMLALVLALVGTGLVVGAQPGDAPMNAAVLGVVLAAAGGSGYGIVIFLGRSLAARCHPLQVTSISFATGALLLLVINLLSGTLVAVYPIQGWLLLIYLGAVPTALAYGLFLAGMRSTPATAASITALLDPVTAAVLAALLFDERFTALGLAGAALLLAALVVLARS